LFRREEIIDIIKHRFCQFSQHNLPIFGIEKSDLRDFTTTEKDMRKGTSKYPPMQFRLKQEDLLKETEVQKPEPQEGQALDDYNENV
jgi:hypothetical protein